MPAGAPIGNQNAKKAKEWTDAIKRVLENYPNFESTIDQVASCKRGLHAIAVKFVRSAYETNDIQFFKEFGDRIEGKPPQSIDMNANIKTHEVAIDELDREGAEDSTPSQG